MITHQEIIDLGKDFLVGNPECTLYALVDHAGAQGLCNQLTRTKTVWRSLFEGSRDEGALEVAPICFSIQMRQTSHSHSHSQTALLKWLCHNGALSSSLIFIVSPLPIEDICCRLSARLDTQLPEKIDVVLRYFDTRVFESLLKVLSDEQKLDFLSPGHRWWYVDRRGDLQHINSTFAFNEGDGMPIVLSEIQESALLNASEPDQVAQLLRTYVPREYAGLEAGSNYDFIVRQMCSARVFGVVSTHDHALYCSLALLIGEDFPAQPKWSAALSEFGKGKTSLSDAIQSADINDEEVK